MRIEEIPLPPASLRTGSSQNRDDAVFLSFARSSARTLIERCSLSGNSSLLDIGCGPARLLYGIVGELKQIRTYVGVDVDKRVIDWLKANVQTTVPFSQFEHLSFFNERYNKQRTPRQRFRARTSTSSPSCPCSPICGSRTSNST